MPEIQTATLMHDRLTVEQVGLARCAIARHVAHLPVDERRAVAVLLLDMLGIGETE